MFTCVNYIKCVDVVKGFGCGKLLIDIIEHKSGKLSSGGILGVFWCVIAWLAGVVGRVG